MEKRSCAARVPFILDLEALNQQWLFVTEEGVFEAARIYARQLLLSTQSPHLNKPAKAVPAQRKTAGRTRAAVVGKTEGV